MNIKNGDSGVGDNVTLVILWWWPIKDVGDRLIRLTTFFVLLMILSNYFIKRLKLTSNENRNLLWTSFLTSTISTGHNRWTKTSNVNKINTAYPEMTSKVNFDFHLTSISTSLWNNSTKSSVKRKKSST